MGYVRNMARSCYVKQYGEEYFVIIRQSKSRDVGYMGTKITPREYQRLAYSGEMYDSVTSRKFESHKIKGVAMRVIERKVYTVPIKER